MTDFNGRGGVITGAVSGIGPLMASDIANAGGRRAGCDIDRDGLKRLKADLASNGAGVPTGR